MHTLPAIVSTVLLLSGTAWAQDKAPLDLVQTIPMEGVQGKIDHLSVDVGGKRLFVATTGNNSVQVIDLAQGKVVHKIEGLPEPQGIAFLPDFKRIAVACGKDGSCRIFDGDSYKLLKSVDFKDDGDNVRYDAAAKRIYVAHEAGGLGIVDAETMERIGDIKLDGHPESFQIEHSGKRIFVNVPDARQVAVVDREKGTVVAKWALDKLDANFPMALDEAHHRLFVGCRKPSKVLVLDTETGKEMALLTISRDTDDLFFDAPTRRIYVSAGEGFIDTIDQKD
ncbi:MAG TPA: YncE family protein, partial [Planctomycetota bacterium]|nr:YncE family protein [Planctomycetota bacterium]